MEGATELARVGRHSTLLSASKPIGSSCGFESIAITADSASDEIEGLVDHRLSAATSLQQLVGRR
jgi:hypothetical protein